MRVTIYICARTASGRGLVRPAVLVPTSTCVLFSRGQPAGRGAGAHSPRQQVWSRMSSPPHSQTHFAHELPQKIMVHGEGDHSGRDPSSRNGRLTVRGTPLFFLPLRYFSLRQAEEASSSY
jgi:hypothetical protein